eukprot:NODE_114_length_3200_cov_37.220882_g104_i0.p1 GENE.NODE_114_length_3200_cov_37.220882_g104_i0~~NODE_114_length_3200_cov_37.220882_g104_i0.p1  ORF type:complete len:1060 (+),score=146.07 NODE_114_length_3200_cov_37.220882_g104_i0:293-3181(+)
MPVGVISELTGPSIRTFFSRLARTGHWDAAMRLAVHIQRGLEPAVRDGVFFELAEQAAACGHWRTVVRLSHLCDSPSTCLAAGLRSGRNLETALSVMQDLPQAQFQDALRLAVTHWIQLGPHTVIARLRSIAKSGVRCHGGLGVETAWSSDLARNCTIQELRALLGSLQTLQWAGEFSAAGLVSLRRFGESSLWTDGWKLFITLVKLGNNQLTQMAWQIVAHWSTFAPDLVMDRLVNILLRHGEDVITCELCDAMHRQGIPISESGYQALLAAAVHNAQWDRSVELIRRMHSQQMSVPRPVMHSVIEALLSSQLVGRAAEVLLCAPTIKDYIEPRLCIEVMLQCGKVGLCDRVVAVLDRVSSSGCAMTVAALRSGGTYGVLIESCAKHQAWGELLSVYAHASAAPAAELDTAALNCVFKAQSQRTDTSVSHVNELGLSLKQWSVSGSFDDLTRLQSSMDSIANSVARRKVCSIALQALERRQQWSKGFCFAFGIARYDDLHQEISEFLLRLPSTVKITQSTRSKLVTISQNDAVKKLLNHLLCLIQERKPTSVPNLLSLLAIEVFADAQKWDLVLRWSELVDSLEDSTVLNHVTQARSKTDGAPDSFHGIHTQEWNNLPKIDAAAKDDSERTRSLAALMESRISARTMHTLQLYGRNDGRAQCNLQGKRFISEESSAIFVAAMLTNGHANKAMLLGDAMHRQGIPISESGYQALLAAAVHNAQWDRSVELIRRMHSQQMSVPRPVMHSVIEALLSSQLVGRAAEVLLCAPTIKDYIEPRLCIEVMLQCGKVGLCDRVVAVLDRVSSSGCAMTVAALRSGGTYGVLIESCAKHQAWGELLSVYAHASAAPAAELDTAALRHVVEAYIHVGMVSSAFDVIAAEGCQTASNRTNDGTILLDSRKVQQILSSHSLNSGLATLSWHARHAVWITDRAAEAVLSSFAAVGRIDLALQCLITRVVILEV